MNWNSLIFELNSPINKILNQKEFDFDEILEYIKEEISFKNDDNNLKVGFLK